MKKKKKRILNFLNFCCMVVVLGTQTLLHGSWTQTVKETETVKANRGQRT